jgi:hypothetical protein
MPNQRMKIGTKAILGAGKATEMSGSSAQRAHFERAIRSPAMTPNTTASARPAKAR